MFPSLKQNKREFCINIGSPFVNLVNRHWNLSVTWKNCTYNIYYINCIHHRKRLENGNSMNIRFFMRFYWASIPLYKNYKLAGVKARRPELSNFKITPSSEGDTVLITKRIKYRRTDGDQTAYNIAFFFSKCTKNDTHPRMSDNNNNKCIR